MNAMHERPATGGGPGTTGNLLRRAGRSACALLALGTAGGPQYACALAGALGIHEETARGYLRRLAELGLAGRRPGGWSLTRAGRALLRGAAEEAGASPRRAEKAGDKPVGYSPGAQGGASRSGPAPQAANPEKAGDNSVDNFSNPLGGRRPAPACGGESAEAPRSGPLEAAKNAETPRRPAPGCAPDPTPENAPGSAEGPRSRPQKRPKSADSPRKSGPNAVLSRARDSSSSTTTVKESFKEEESLIIAVSKRSRARERAGRGETALPKPAAASGKRPAGKPPSGKRAPGTPGGAPQAVPGALGTGESSRPPERLERNLRALAAFGLLPNRRTRALAAREGLTPEYIAAHARLLEDQLRRRGQSLAAHTGLLLVVLESGAPPPALNPQGHLQGCRCESCRRAAYRLWDDL